MSRLSHPKLPLAGAFASLLLGAQAIVMPDGHTVQKLLSPPNHLQPLTRSQGKLPTLGWNSWNAYHCDITEDKFLSAAQVIVDQGLLAAGYDYVNIDDCWSDVTGRDASGHLVPNATRFPDGIDGLASKIHNMSLHMGIYSTAGTLTCGGYPASLGYEDTDAADFASWGIDFLKYDNCNVPANWTDEYVFCNPDYVNTTTNGTCNTTLDPTLAPPGYNWSTSLSNTRFNRMRDALAKQDREIIYNLCIWGQADVYSWGNETAISWRMSNDIEADWADVTRIINENSFRMNSVNFWSHNDADMLEVGNINSTVETRSHFAMWAAMKSPLIIGTDMTVLSDDNIALLKNKYLLAFNQDDVYGEPATPYKWGTNPDWTFNLTNPAEYWAGASQNGTLVLMLNTLSDTAARTADWAEVPGLNAGCSYQVTDVWDGSDLGCLSNYTAQVASHDTAVILVGDEC